MTFSNKLLLRCHGVKKFHKSEIGKHCFSLYQKNLFIIPHFLDCGEGKAKKDLASRNALPSKNKRSPQEEMEVTANPVDDGDNLEFFSYSTNESLISCGSTIINDRFIIFAAHCQSNFQK